MKHLIATELVCLFAVAGLSLNAGAQNLMPNGAMNDPENPTKGWVMDYKELNNSFYNDNISRVKFLASDSGKKGVIKMETKGTGMGQGVWLDSPSMPFEQGCRYKISLNIRASAPYHIYVAGYQLKPGIRPSDSPSWFDLRTRYKGGWFPVVKGLASWQKITMEFPDKQLSALAMKNIKDVKYISIHFCAITGEGEVNINNLEVEKLPDAYTGGKVTEDDRRTNPAAAATSKKK